MPTYGLIQIEPTSRCNLRCRTCLRSSHPGQWRQRDLSFSLFQRLRGEFTRAAVVHLQGWGEPLLLDSFPRYLSLAKQSGCRVSFTTNGQIMDADLAASLIESGVDGVTFSMAGPSPEVQDHLRGPGSYEHLEASVSILAAAKKKIGSKTPKLAISYLLTPATIKGLPQALRWCGKHGISLLAGIHLTHAANHAQLDIQLFPGKDRHLKSLVRRAHIQALFSGVDLQLPSFSPQRLPVCSKNPLQNLSIAADGSVAPCVFLNAPVAESLAWLCKKGSMGNTPYVFGNVHQDSLIDIRQTTACRQFRELFARRIDFYQRTLARVGYGMDATEKLASANRLIRQYFIDNPPPSPCRGCPKLLGY